MKIECRLLQNQKERPFVREEILSKCLTTSFSLSISSSIFLTLPSCSFYFSRNNLLHLLSFSSRLSTKRFLSVFSLAVSSWQLARFILSFSITSMSQTMFSFFSVSSLSCLLMISRRSVNSCSMLPNISSFSVRSLFQLIISSIFSSSSFILSLLLRYFVLSFSYYATSILPSASFCRFYSQSFKFSIVSFLSSSITFLASRAVCRLSIFSYNY